MAKLALNKSSMHRESKRLKSYQQFLPALDLKRKQIIAERFKARQRLAELDQQLQALRQQVGEQLPMLAELSLDLDELVQVERFLVEQENLVGIHLPRLQTLEIRRASYSVFALPHWVDALVNRLQETVHLRLEAEVQQRRLQLLDKALQKTTQRINLFDKVLIPEARSNIRRIGIYLSDAERAGVVRAKLSKDKKRRAVG